MKAKTLNCILCDNDDMAPGRRYCKSCHNSRRTKTKKETNREHYRRNRLEIRERQVWQRLKDRYGVTKEQYEQMLANQNGVCGICKKPCKTNQRLAVDHCHKTGRVRGLLCKSCNMSLGVVEKDGWLARAFKYLEQDQ